MTETTFQDDVEASIEETLQDIEETNYSDPGAVIAQEAAYIAESLSDEELLQVAKRGTGVLNNKNAVGENVFTVLTNAAFEALELEMIHRMEEDD